MHYQVKKSYEPLLLSVNEEDSKVEIYAVNDDLQSYDGVLKVELVTFDGNVVWESSETITIESNSSAVIKTIQRKDFSVYDLSQFVLKVTFNANDKKTQSLYFFEKPKNLKLTQPNIHVKRLTANSIEITSDVLAKNVMLFSDKPTHFSDNILICCLMKNE